MYRKWLGWKKVAVCLVGAAMIMQGASIAMASDEYLRNRKPQLLTKMHRKV